jgi:hypothetical protein
MRISLQSPLEAGRSRQSPQEGRSAHAAGGRLVTDPRAAYLQVSVVADANPGGISGAGPPLRARAVIEDGNRTLSRPLRPARRESLLRRRCRRAALPNAAAPQRG